MFADLNEKLSGVFKRLKGETRISEANIADAVKQVRMALLEADVNYKVVKSFIAGVQEAALGESVIKSVSPSSLKLSTIILWIFSVVKTTRHHFH